VVDPLSTLLCAGSPEPCSLPAISARLTA
jgi:hypothetical protein